MGRCVERFFTQTFADSDGRSEVEARIQDSHSYTVYGTRQTHILSLLNATWGHHRVEDRASILILWWPNEEHAPMHKVVHSSGGSSKANPSASPLC